MGRLIPLDPAPQVEEPPLVLTAFEAGRTPLGIVATVQVAHGDTVLALQGVQFGNEAQRVQLGQAVAAADGLGDAAERATVQGLLTLHAAVELALRTQPTRRPSPTPPQDTPPY